MNTRLVELLTTEKVVERGGEWTSLSIAEARHVARLAEGEGQGATEGACCRTSPAWGGTVVHELGCARRARGRGEAQAEGAGETVDRER